MSYGKYEKLKCGFSEGLGEEVKFEDSGLTYGINECVRECKSRGSIVSTTSKLKVTETNQSTSNHNDTKVLNASDTGIQTNENLLLGNTADVSAVIKDGHIQKQKRVWSKFRSVPNSVSSGEETLSTIHLVEKCVKDWLTIETVKYLLGPEKYSEILNDETLIIETDKSSELKKGENERQIVTKFKRLCKKLDFEEREDNALDAEFIRTECNASMKKKVPSYERLSRETKKYNLKVEAFYNGKMEILSDEDDETNVSNNSRTKDTKECVSTNEVRIQVVQLSSMLFSTFYSMV